MAISRLAKESDEINEPTPLHNTGNKLLRALSIKFVKECFSEFSIVLYTPFEAESTCRIYRFNYSNEEWDHEAADKPIKHPEGKERCSSSTPSTHTTAIPAAKNMGP